MNAFETAKNARNLKTSMNFLELYPQMIVTYFTHKGEKSVI